MASRVWWVLKLQGRAAVRSGGPSGEKSALPLQRGRQADGHWALTLLSLKPEGQGAHWGSCRPASQPVPRARWARMGLSWKGTRRAAQHLPEIIRPEHSWLYTGSHEPKGRKIWQGRDTCVPFVLFPFSHCMLLSPHSSFLTKASLPERPPPGSGCPPNTTDWFELSESELDSISARNRPS